MGPRIRYDERRKVKKVDTPTVSDYHRSANIDERLDYFFTGEKPCRGKKRVSEYRRKIWTG